MGGISVAGVGNKGRGKARVEDPGSVCIRHDLEVASGGVGKKHAKALDLVYLHIATLVEWLNHVGQAIELVQLCSRLPEFEFNVTRIYFSTPYFHRSFQDALFTGIGRVTHCSALLYELPHSSL